MSGFDLEDQSSHSSSAWAGDSAEAYWRHRFFLRDRRDRILQLSQAVNVPTDLSLPQWAQLMAFALAFQPDMILELGRGYGNSTCAFTEVANALGPAACRVLSVCRTPFWEEEVLARVREVVPEDWFAPLLIVRADILEHDFDRSLQRCNRVLMLWDAHGYEIAECVLGRILPLIAVRPHLVVMHDLSDARYYPDSFREYNNKGIWRRGGGSERLRIGHIDSAEEQAVAIVDFASRNHLPLHSAGHRFHQEFGTNSRKAAELRETVGDELYSLQGDWFWFSLNEIPGPYTFPRFKGT